MVSVSTLPGCATGRGHFIQRSIFHLTTNRPSVRMLIGGSRILISVNSSLANLRQTALRQMTPLSSRSFCGDSTEGKSGTERLLHKEFGILFQLAEDPLRRSPTLPKSPSRGRDRQTSRLHEIQKVSAARFKRPLQHSSCSR